MGVVTPQQTKEELKEYIEELSFLSFTADIHVIKNFTQKLNTPDTKMFIGKGKAHEINDYVKEHNIDYIIFDDELSPSQLRNLEKFFNCIVIDRTRLILNIFLQRAQTSYAKTQVKLAHYQYMLPRLTRMWTHLERQRGGTNTRGGAGEQEIETDRRIIRNQISILKEKLKNIDKQKQTQRGNRYPLIRVALVGYTNVGKSTLMNLLGKSKVLAENKLFATLDTTVRKVVIENLPFLLSDTVGFIRKLPHHLVDSFKSTLDEVKEADILLHIVDVSHPCFEDQIKVVNSTLSSIEAINKPMIMVFNKTDNYEYTEPSMHEIISSEEIKPSLDTLIRNLLLKYGKNNCVFISATKKENIMEFKQLLYDHIKSKHLKKFPHKLLY